jgi:hypothetical protein
MQPLRLAVGSAAVALVTFGGSALIGQEGVLRYRWTKGEPLRYRIVQETNATMTGVPGMGEMTIRNTMTQMQQFTPKDVAGDGTATLEARFESVKMEMGTPMGTFTYDSANPAQNSSDQMVAQIAATMGALVGESITLVMSPNGAIQKIEGLTRIRQKVEQTTPQAASALGMGGLDAILSDEALKGSYGQGFSQLPATPVKPGDTWKNDLTMPNPFGTMNFSTTHSLKAVETAGGKDLARIAMTSTIKAAPANKPPPFPMPVTIQFSDGTGEGEMIFDRKLGRAQTATFLTTLPMSMNMTAPDGSALNIQAMTKSTTSIELIEK